MARARPGSASSSRAPQQHLADADQGGRKDEDGRVCTRHQQHDDHPSDDVTTYRGRIELRPEAAAEVELSRIDRLSVPT